MKPEIFWVCEISKDRGVAKNRSEASVSGPIPHFPTVGASEAEQSVDQVTGLTDTGQATFSWWSTVEVIESVLP